MQILATKAAYLFTAATASVAAGGAYLGFVLDDIDVEFNVGMVALVFTGVAYAFLCVCFACAYLVRDFDRSPEPEELIKYIHMPLAKTIEDIADGRRVAVGNNDHQLELQADWVNRELFTVILIIAGLGLALVSLSVS